MPVVAAYPNNFPSFVPKVDDVDTVWADHVNTLQAEVLAIATVLGTLPQGAQSSVKARLAAVESTANAVAARFDSNGLIPQAGVVGLSSTLASMLSAVLFDAKGDLLVGSGNDTLVKLGVGATGTILTSDPAAAGGMSWQAPGLAATLFDVKGDLLAATADNTPARLPVGANGQALMADSTQPTGLGWKQVHLPIGFHFPGNFTTGYKTPLWIAPVNLTLVNARAKVNPGGPTATYGVAVNGSMVTSVGPAIGGSVSLWDFTDVNINAGDYVQIQIYDNSSATAVDLSITIDAVMR